MILILFLDSIAAKYYAFFLGHYCEDSVVSTLPLDIFVDLFRIQLNEWLLYTPENIGITNKTTATKVKGMYKRRRHVLSYYALVRD
jgi:hypothetical protein